LAAALVVWSGGPAVERLGGNGGSEQVTHSLGEEEKENGSRL
jgi:hypothetical protein